MRVYIGFDDTDHIDADRGTGKLARWFKNELPAECSIWGVVRQQLLVHDSIPYTSHNSSACAVVDAPDDLSLETLIDRASRHIEALSLDGSDPGLCVVHENTPSLPELIAFGRTCTERVVTQREAMEAASGGHLSGHGGDNQGIIGAAAAVGLTAEGWNGRFIEYGALRDLPDKVLVSDLQRLNILVVSMDRDARVPSPLDIVSTKGWLRPRLWGLRAIVPVVPTGEGCWESVGEKGRNNGGGIPRGASGHQKVPHLRRGAGKAR